MRVMNWEIGLVAFAGRERGKDFEWGVTDCASMVCRSLEIMHGVDIIIDAGKWASKIGAMRLHKKTDLSVVLFDAGGIEIHAKFATTGDIALGPSNDVDGLPQLAIVLPCSRVLMSSIDDGVHIGLVMNLLTDTRFFRHV